MYGSVGEGNDPVGAPRENPWSNEARWTGCTGLRTNMTVAHWTEADSNRAQEIWSDYQQHDDLSDKAGQTAGIDPRSGSIWFGKSIQDVIAQRDADGSKAPLFFVRVGSATYYRKGGHR
jgi:hypothetical protein